MIKSACRLVVRQLRNAAWAAARAEVGATGFVIAALRWRVQWSGSGNPAEPSFAGQINCGRQKRLVSSFFPLLLLNQPWRIHSTRSRSPTLRRHRRHRVRTKRTERPRSPLSREPCPLLSDRMPILTDIRGAFPSPDPYARLIDFTLRTA